MTTTPGDRQILRDWRDTHDDVQPDRDGRPCKKTVWLNDRAIGSCNKTSVWIVDYTKRVPQLGRKPYCEPHTVELIKTWTAFEAEAKKVAT